MIGERFSRFFPDLDIGSDSLDVDLFLFNFRWFVGNTDCTGPSESSESLGYRVRFPYNSAEAVLRQLSIPAEEVIDKRVLKKHSSQRFPALSQMIWFPKDNSIGASADGPCAAGPEWMRALQSSFAAVPPTPLIDQDQLQQYVFGTRSGSFAGSTNETPTERQLHLTSLMMRRAS